jgi:hypothetical protein
MKTLSRVLSPGVLVASLLLLGGPVHASPITFTNSSVSASGNISVTASDSGVGDDISLVNSVFTAGGLITLSAGDNVNLDSTSTLTAATNIAINLDFGNSDPGLGGVFSFFGGLFAPTIVVNGGTDSDTINFLGLAATLLFDPSDPLSGTLTFGSSVLTFHNIENITGNVTTTSPVPEPASILRVSTGIAGLVARARRRR